MGSGVVGSSSPEGSCLVIVLDHAGLLPFKIKDAARIWFLLSNVLYHSFRMGFRWIFAIEDSFYVRHCGIPSLLLLREHRIQSSLQIWDGLDSYLTRAADSAQVQEYVGATEMSFGVWRTLLLDQVGCCFAYPHELYE